MRLSKELSQEIDNLKIEGNANPSQIGFYLTYYKNALACAREDIKTLEDDLAFFQKLKLLHTGDIEVCKKLSDLALKLKDEIQDNKNLVCFYEKKIKEFVILKQHYAEDFKNGKYYDKETGEITDDLDNTYKPIASQKAG